MGTSLLNCQGVTTGGRWPLAFTTWLPGVPRSVPTGRAWVVAAAAAVAAPQVQTEDAELLASEVLTNAVVHSKSAGADGPGVDLEVMVEPGRLAVAVTDAGGDSDPARVDHGPEAESGRGMDLLALLANEWGSVGDSDGRMVWFAVRWDAR